MTSTDRDVLIEYIGARLDRTETAIKSYVDARINEQDKRIDSSLAEFKSYTDKKFEQIHASIVQIDKQQVYMQGELYAINSRLDTLQTVIYYGFAFLSFVAAFVSRIQKGA